MRLLKFFRARRASNNGGPQRKRVAVFSEGFQPAFKVGGPAQSLEALVRGTPARYSSMVFCSNRDHGEKSIMQVESGKWVSCDGGEVYYVDKTSPIRYVAGLIQVAKRRPWTIFFASFFSPQFTIIPLFLHQLGFCRHSRIVISPRGEFGNSALGHHNLRKTGYVWLFRILGFDRKIVWHSTAGQETEDIIRVWGSHAQVVFRENDVNLPFSALLPRDQGKKARLVFVSRIVALKGLHIVLDALKGCGAALTLDVFGPIEDHGYFEDCRRVAAKLPQNVQVRFLGPVAHDKVRSVFAEHEAFVFPTAGENFGHVIAEALSASCYVITTAMTPWSSILRKGGGGTVIESRSPEDWEAAIQWFVGLQRDRRMALRRKAGLSFEWWRRRAADRHLWELVDELFG